MWLPSQFLHEPHLWHLPAHDVAMVITAAPRMKTRAVRNNPIVNVPPTSIIHINIISVKLIEICVISDRVSLFKALSSSG